MVYLSQLTCKSNCFQLKKGKTITSMIMIRWLYPKPASPSQSTDSGAPVPSSLTGLTFSANMNTFTHFHRHLREWSQIFLEKSLSNPLSPQFVPAQCCSYVRPFNYPVQIALFCLPDIQYSVTLFAFPLLLLKLLKWILLLSVNFHSQDHRRDGGQGPGLSKENRIFAHPTVLTHTRHQHRHPLFCLLPSFLLGFNRRFDESTSIILICSYSESLHYQMNHLTTNPVTVTTFKNIMDMNWNFFRLCLDFLRIVIIL